uniref:Uncharacterized protein n=1 Tax=Malurus cyaneus samueli TaxID=2593467 RepID=A0A8C5UB17_9PASS
MIRTALRFCSASTSSPAPAPARRSPSLQFPGSVSPRTGSLMQNPSPTHPGLQLLDLLLPSLQGQLLCFIQTVLQVLHSLVQVLLHPLQVILCPHSIIQMNLSVLERKRKEINSIQGALQGLHHSEMVSLQLVNLLIFLCYLPDLKEGLW